ncbi:MAG: 2-oxoglutarate dehydrogenase E1 component [Pantoea sp. Brub]|nr:2-oxoglutarate dehydrogenase E1 component [Pantoea sp. Brub]
MQNNEIIFLLNSSWLSGINQSYIENLYEDFLINSNSVDKDWYNVFTKIAGTDISLEQLHSRIRESFRFVEKKFRGYNLEHVCQDLNILQKIKIYQLIDIFRYHGHQYANLDPLGLYKKSKINTSLLDLNDINFQEIININCFGIKYGKFTDLIKVLEKIYCKDIGFEYMHVNEVKEKLWIQEYIESTMGMIEFSAEEQKIFLQNLISAEGLEKYLSTKFPGAKRFSIEGGEVLIPMLRQIISHSAKQNIQEIVIGMAHRGRLNVLINVLGKKSQDLFDEFSGKYTKKTTGTGDVKYHMGFSSNMQTTYGLIHLVLAFNPSHLEIINPVIMGSVRARIDRINNINNNILPINIHGDAAVIAQGVVQETLNMSQTPSYTVGGTLHIVINNQIGFTTSNPKDARSTIYCTDIGKMISVPIFHVNSDNIEAVIFVTRLALEYRNKFKKDVFIDLVCYRRHGHNEADEPSVTQPLMYQKVQKHPSINQIYSEFLIQQGILNKKDIIDMTNNYYDKLHKGSCTIDELRPIDLNSCIWAPYLNYDINKENLYYISSNVQKIQKLATCINTIPNEINIQTQVAKIYNARKQMAEGLKDFDWGAAENLAYATILDQGVSIRFSGEDSSRGTFFHRHAVIHDQINGSTYIPLNYIRKNQGSFTICDSVLSEEGVLAFEYGYSITNPDVLTIWEAQFGDFANGAQVVIDQFISSGEQKWGKMSGIVMLLPHGYEGQGPEHSSARLERYLQLCAENNMQICIPSTPAQVYHMLVRQALSKVRKPLIVMSPKSLLRHPLSSSNLEEIVNGQFQSVIGEIKNVNPKYIKKIIMCSGKVFFDLFIQRNKKQKNDVIIIRIEQLYPFPYQAIKKILKSYFHVKDFIWCQEEPLNQGAWYYIQYHVRKVIPADATLKHVSRPESASPAVGYTSLHQQQQQNLINEALVLIS